MTPTIAFSDLLSAARGGDPDALDRLFARAAERLQVYIRFRIGERLRRRIESVDVLQETFVHACRDVAGFDPEGADDPERRFAQWLCRIADRRILDLADRHGAARRAVGREERAVTEVLHRIQQSGHGPATSVVRRDERLRLVEALEALDPDDRDVLLLRHFEGRTIDAIAERTGRSPSAIRRTLGRVTAALGRRLQESEA